MHIKLAWMVLILLLISCDSAAPPSHDSALPALTPVDLSGEDRLRVVATTSIIGDVVAQVGGEWIDLTVLIQPGQDPHSYEPAAADFALMQSAHVIYTNGLNFEEGLLANLDTLEGVPLVPVSIGVDTIEGDSHEEELEAEHAHTADPHVWQDPHNVMIWAQNIADTLSALDPSHAEQYRANAAAYFTELESLDTYIAQQVERIPPDQRKLVTNHDTFAYFARRYGFEIVGTVLIGASDLAEPSAGELAALVETIRTENVPAIFIEHTVGDSLAQVISAEVGQEVQLLTLYTDSLGIPGSGAESYLAMMRANIEIIVEGLGNP